MAIGGRTDGRRRADGQPSAGGTDSRRRTDGQLPAHEPAAGDRRTSGRIPIGRQQQDIKICIVTGISGAFGGASGRARESQIHYKICKLHKTPFPTKKSIEQESYCNSDFWLLRGRIRAEARGLLLLCFLKNHCFATFSPQSWKTIKLKNLYCNWDFRRLWWRFRAGPGIPNTI